MGLRILQVGVTLVIRNHVSLTHTCLSHVRLHYLESESSANAEDACTPRHPTSPLVSCQQETMSTSSVLSPAVVYNCKACPGLEELGRYITNIKDEKIYMKVQFSSC